MQKKLLPILLAADAVQLLLELILEVADKKAAVALILEHTAVEEEAAADAVCHILEKKKAAVALILEHTAVEEEAAADAGRHILEKKKAAVALILEHTAVEEEADNYDQLLPQTLLHTLQILPHSLDVHPLLYQFYNIHYHNVMVRLQ
jgi:succinyl-CoA synthetase alpha subunit